MRLILNRSKHPAPSSPQGTLQRVSREPHQCPFAGPSDPVRSGGAGDSHYALPAFNSPAHGRRGPSCLPGPAATGSTLPHPALTLPFQKSPVTVCFSTASFQYHYPLSFAEAERRGTLGTEYPPQKKVAEGPGPRGRPDPALSSSSSTNKEASCGLGFLVVLLPGLSI